MNTTLKNAGQLKLLSYNVHNMSNTQFKREIFLVNMHRCICSPSELIHGEPFPLFWDATLFRHPDTNYKFCAISGQVASFLWKGEDGNRDPCGPHQTTTHCPQQGAKPCEQLVSRETKDSLPPPGINVLQSAAPSSARWITFHCPEPDFNICFRIRNTDHKTTN